MNKNTKKWYNEEEYVAETELLVVENIILLFVIALAAYVFWDGNSENILSFVFCILVIIYCSTFLLIRKIYFFSDHLIIFYPTRFFLKKRRIEYSDIKKIKYIYSNSAYAVPEIQIKRRSTIFPHIYISLSYNKRKEILQKLYRTGLNIEINSENKKDQFYMGKGIKSILILVIATFLLFSCTFGDKKRTYKESFQGVIVKNYRDDHNHGMSTFDVKNGNYYFKVLSEVWPRCWEYADIGDSVIKPKDTLLLIIKKPDGAEKHFYYDW